MSKEGFVQKMNDVIIFYTCDKNDIEKIVKDFPQLDVSFKQSKLCVFARNKERVIGASCVRGILSVSSTYVVEEYRGRGIGTVLLKNAIAIAKREGYCFVIGTVGWGNKDYNLSARKIVQKSGDFRKVTDIAKVSVVIWPLESITGNFVFTCARTFFSLIPKLLHREILELVSVVALFV
jgi:predicted GNAT family acetyltransferase